MQRVNFTFADWVAHRSTSRYARHLSGIFQYAAAQASLMASVHLCIVLCDVISVMSQLPVSRLSAIDDELMSRHRSYKALSYMQIKNFQRAAANIVGSDVHCSVCGHLRDTPRCGFLRLLPPSCKHMTLHISSHGDDLIAVLQCEKSVCPAAPCLHPVRLAVPDSRGQSSIQPHQLRPLTAAGLQVSPCAGVSTC